MTDLLYLLYGDAVAGTPVPFVHSFTPNPEAVARRTRLRRGHLEMTVRTNTLPAGEYTVRRFRESAEYVRVWLTGPDGLPYTMDMTAYWADSFLAARRKRWPVTVRIEREYGT